MIVNGMYTTLILIESEVTLRGNVGLWPLCIDRAMARPVSQGGGLSFPCSDQTDEVNKLFILWPLKH